MKLVNFSVGLTLASPHFVKSTFGASHSDNDNVVNEETIDSEIRLYALCSAGSVSGHSSRAQRSLGVLRQGVSRSGCTTSCCHCSPSSFWVTDTASDSLEGCHKGSPRKQRNVAGHRVGSPKGRFRPYWKQKSLGSQNQFSQFQAGNAEVSATTRVFLMTPPRAVGAHPLVAFKTGNRRPS